MELFRTVVLAAFLVYIGCSCIIEALKTTSPAYGKKYPYNYYDAANKRVLRVHETTEKENVEERGWLTDSITSGKLTLNKLMVGNALKNPKKMENLWTKVADFNKDKIPTEKISVTGKLMEKYGDDAVMAAIVKAKQVDNTKDVAAKLETDLILNYAAIFKGWKYVGEDIDDILTKGLGGENNVLPIIAAAMREPSTTKSKVEELNKLEAKLLVRKMENQMNILDIDDRTSVVFNSQNLKILNNYISNLKTRFPGNQVSFLRILTTKYADGEVAKRLSQAAAGSTNQIVKTLQQQQFTKWWNKKKSIDDVFYLLKLEQPQLNIVDSRGLGVLKDYIAFLNGGKPNMKTFFSVLSKNYGGEANFAVVIDTAREVGSRLGPRTTENAKALQKQLFQLWKDEGVNSVSVYTTKLKVFESEDSTGRKRVANRFKQFLSDASVGNPTRL